MGLIDQKADIFGKIGAARTVAEGLPDLVTNPSFPSINNDGDGIAFLVDLLKSLVGLDQLREVVIDTLAYKLDDMEISIKTAMKLSLKELVNCGVYPSIPSYIQSTGIGITTEVDKVDFFNMMKTDPSSSTGKLMYSDIQSPLTNSSDYNTFIYGTIQNDGTVETWGNGSQILNVRFDSINPNPTPNNTLTFNTHSSFDNKTLTDFNNTYIDSIDLFNSANLLNKILDDLFGTLSFNISKTSEQLKKEEEVKTIVDNIITAEEDDVIDESYFTFTNDEVAKQETNANWRKNGIRPVETCGSSNTSLSITTLSSISTNIDSSPQGEIKKTAISDGLKELSNNIGNQSSDTTNKYALELNFIEGIIHGIVTSIVSFILSPKIVSIFLVNYKIVYGVNEEYEDATDFMKQNKNLMVDVTKAVKNAIISTILNAVLKQVSILVSQTIVEIATEKAKNQLAQILSLVGVPAQILRIIKGL